MTADPVTSFIDRHVAAWNTHDIDALCSHYAEAGVVVSPMFARVQGRHQICATYHSIFRMFPDWQVRFGAPIREGNRIAVPFSVTATQQGEFMGVPGTGRRVDFEGVSLYELDADRLIQEERRVYDFTGLLTRLGVLKVKPGG